MLDAFLRFARRLERRVPAMVLGVFAVLLLSSAVVGVVKARDGGGEAAQSTTSTSTAGRVPPGKLSTIAFTLNNPGKPAKTACALHAASAAQREKGLMGIDDVAGFDGMIFSFESDGTAPFYMANVPEPLDIAWFTADGSFVSSTAMQVCRVAANKCPLYNALGSYRYALETRAGGLEALGVGSGTSLVLGAPGGCA